MNKTQYLFLRKIFGAAAADRLSKYQYWVVPPCQNVDPPRITSKVEAVEKINWPEWQRSQFVNFRITPMADGVMLGRPMQWGLGSFRIISWGYLEYGYKFRALLPNPVGGWYWRTGHPVPMYDVHCIVREPHPTKAVFHEMIQLDPSVKPDNVFVNNALGWGRFEDGELVDGTYSTAPDIAAHPYVWTPWSKENVHRCALTVTDYRGADGDLEGVEGVEAGSLVVLPRDSQSYLAMKALGGECAILAEALAEYGAVVIDRGGTPSIAIQPGAQWATTNIGKLSIRQSDFVSAVEAA
jgi:hypothetical protein